MSSTFSPSLKLELVGNGDQSGTWGTTTNNNFGTLLEQAITGVQDITMSNADYTLTNLNGVSDEARNAVLVLGGTNSAIKNVIVPAVNKLYIIINNTSGGYAVNIKTSSSTGVNIANGGKQWVYCNGTEVYVVDPRTGYSTGTGNYVLANSPTIDNLTVTTAAAIANATLTGVPTAPTAPAGTNTTQLATTQFVLSNGVPSGAIMLWSGSIVSIPSGWYLCNGSNGTPDLRDRFVIAAGLNYAVAATGGSADSIVVSHTHSATTAITDPGHAHATLPSTSAQRGTDNGGTATLTAGNERGSENPTASAITGITAATTVVSAGSSGVGANLPPYYALAYIMKA